MAINELDAQQIADLSPENDYFPVTPEQKIDSLKENSREPMSEIFVGSVIESAYHSTKEFSEAMSSSSSSSLSDAYNLSPENYLLQNENDDDDDDKEVMNPRIIHVDEKENLHLGNGVLLKNVKGLEYEELLERVSSYEIELKFAKKKLQFKEDEICQLKYENFTLVEDLRICEENMVKMEDNFRNELDETRDLLVSELDSERKLVSELQGLIVEKMNDLGEYFREVDELKCALHDAQKDFMKNRSKLESEISQLQEKRDVLDARVKDVELRNKFLEEEKTEMKSLLESQVTGLQDEIRTLNKTLEDNRLMHEILEAEKDEVLEKMQKYIEKLTAENQEMRSELKKTQKNAEELQVKVENQEKELEKQRVVITERAYEKREAIKQLCFSLEYYRNEYREICQAIFKHKRPVALAS